MASTSSQPAERIGFFRALWRAIRQVFHETIGAVFFLLAYGWTVAALRSWKHGTAAWLLGGCAAVVLLMIFFGVVSFRAARRVR